MRPVIAIVGSRTLDPQVAALVSDLGSRIARAGFNLVCGGLGGAMEAACCGFRQGRDTLPLGERDGLVAIGILPGGAAADANPYVDFALPTAMHVGRNVLVVRAADVVVAVEGGSGTLSEIAYAWQLDKPIVALVPTGGWAARLAGQRLDDRRADPVMAAHSAQECLALIRTCLAAKLEVTS